METELPRPIELTASQPGAVFRRSARPHQWTKRNCDVPIAVRPLAHPERLTDVADVAPRLASLPIGVDNLLQHAFWNRHLPLLLDLLSPLIGIPLSDSLLHSGDRPSNPTNRLSHEAPELGIATPKTRELVFLGIQSLSHEAPELGIATPKTRELVFLGIQSLSHEAPELGIATSHTTVHTLWFGKVSVTKPLSWALQRPPVPSGGGATGSVSVTKPLSWALQLDMLTAELNAVLDCLSHEAPELGIATEENSPEFRQEWRKRPTKSP